MAKVYDFFSSSLTLAAIAMDMKGKANTRANSHERRSWIEMQRAAIECTKQFNNTVKGKYSIWRKDYNNHSTLKLMKDHIIMTKMYASIACSKKEFDLYDFLLRHIKNSWLAVGDAIQVQNCMKGISSSHFLNLLLFANHSVIMLEIFLANILCSWTSESNGPCFIHGKGHATWHWCSTRKLRTMVQSADESINAVKKQNTFLV